MKGIHKGQLSDNKWATNSLRIFTKKQAIKQQFKIKVFIDELSKIKNMF